jgi:hypothetical protein
MFFLGTVVLLATGTTSFAQEAYPVYSAKFVCGPIAADADVVQGQYATTVNIHNPQPGPVTFEKKAVIALPERSTTRGAISNIRTETLEPDQAMGVDCKDIRGLFPAGTRLGEHSEGFVVITVKEARFDVLDVVSVYSARHNDVVEDDDDDDDDGDDDDGAKEDEGDDDDGDDDDDDNDDDGVESLHIEEVNPKFIPILGN